MEVKGQWYLNSPELQTLGSPLASLPAQESTGCPALAQKHTTPQEGWVIHSTIDWLHTAINHSLRPLCGCPYKGAVDLDGWRQEEVKGD